MSHFSVAVITEEKPTQGLLDKVLEPFQEHSSTGKCPKKFLIFHDVEDEYHEEYLTKSTEMVKLPDGELVLPWDERFRRLGTFGTGSHTHEAPAYYERVQIPHRERFATFDDYMREWHGYEKRDEETGRYGYWENPNKKWDWWTVGGRWSGMLIVNGFVHKGIQADSARLDELDLDAMAAEGRAGQEKAWEKAQTEDPAIRAFIYDIGPDTTREEYIARGGQFSTFAVLKDGQWYERGQMGWWGMVADKKDDSVWSEEFDKLLKELPPTHWITIVDCHI